MDYRGGFDLWDFLLDVKPPSRVSTYQPSLCLANMLSVVTIGSMGRQLVKRFHIQSASVNVTTMCE